METIIALVVGLAAGIGTGFLLLNRERAAGKALAESLQQQLAAEQARAAEQLATEQARAAEQLATEQARAAEQLAAEQARAAEQLATEQARAAEQLAAEQARAEAAINRERENSQKLREESEKQWNQRFETLRQEMQKNTSQELASKQEQLQENNRAQMGELLKPLKEQFEAFRKSVEENSKQNALNKDKITSSFEQTLKLFQQEQEHAVKSLREETSRIGTDAANLTKALKGENKTQGDWGEMVLESILESSGLAKDREYFVQENIKDEEGKNFRPDVIVRFPEGRSVVIDSKVSITNYSNAVAATSDAEYERLMNEHVKSLRRHVDELAAKDYSKLVEDAIGFVLLFVPNESSYIAAMRRAPSLSQEAYKKRIIIISPSNLLMALQLAFNLWQYDRQNKNVENIVKKAADLYDKMVGFTEDMADIDNRITSLKNKFAETQNRLSTGKGNVMRRLEELKEMGITPKKSLKVLND